MPIGVSRDAVGIRLPLIHGSVKVSSLGEIEIDHAAKTGGRIFGLVVNVGIVKVAGHIKAIGPLRGAVIGVSAAPALQCGVAGIAQSEPTLDVNIFYNVASEAIDAKLFDPRGIPFKSPP